MFPSFAERGGVQGERADMDKSLLPPEKGHYHPQEEINLKRKGVKKRGCLTD